MTNEELRTLDRKVLDALGIEYVFWSSPDLTVCRGPMVEAEDGTFFESRPSTDWNAAMFAAERCREFVRDYVVFPRGWNKDGSGSVCWVVSKVNSQNELGDDFVSDPSGALAICRAILKLKVQE